MAANHVVGVICTGCGATDDDHRPDCTAHPGDLHCTVDGCPAVRKAGAKTPVWTVRGNPRGYRCPDHREEPL